MFAESVVRIDFVTTSGAFAVLHFLSGFIDKGGGNDTRGDGDDGITKQHDEGREQSSERCGGCDVAVTDGGHGDDGVIDGRAKVGKLGAGLITFYEIHECSDTRNEYQNEHEVNHNLAHAASKGLQE